MLLYGRPHQCFSTEQNFTSLPGISSILSTSSCYRQLYPLIVPFCFLSFDTKIRSKILSISFTCHHILHTPYVIIMLVSLIPFTILFYVYCPLSYPTLLSCTYCPLSYPPHSSPVHTAHCHTLHTPLLYILPSVTPSTLLSCTYCPLSHPPHSSPVHTALCHTLHTPLLYILPPVI
ncbi:unnamed protein product, partial [Staurois parvus]